MSEIEEKETIEKIKTKYYQEDHFPNHLGIEIKELSSGHCVVEMEIKEKMTNFHGIAHGGALFSLADTAFGLASNSRGAAVALQVSINYLVPAKVGQRLRAIATEEKTTRSTGIYNITVENEEKEVIILFRGVVYRLHHQR